MKNTEKNKEKDKKSKKKISFFVPDFSKSDEKLIKKKLRDLGYW